MKHGFQLTSLHQKSSYINVRMAFILMRFNLVYRIISWQFVRAQRKALSNKKKIKQKLDQKCPHVKYVIEGNPHNDNLWIGTKKCLYQTEAIQV